MYPKSFEYLRAESVEHAIYLLREHGQDARLLAGGASLIPLMKLRLATPTHLIDIGRLTHLGGVRREDGAFVLGALARHADLERHADLCQALAIVHDAAAHIGDAQVRNMGTVGGGIAECDPAGDWPPVLLALAGEVTAVGPTGARDISADDLFVDAYTTSLARDELISAVRLRLAAPGERFGAAHFKLERRAGDFAIANCSVALTLDSSGRVCESIRIALGGVAAVPMRVADAEALLAGHEPTPSRLDEAAAVIIAMSESFDDVRGSAEYRRHMGGVVFRRAFEVARRRANNEHVEVRDGH